MKVSGKWGYIDHSGKIVIEPQFEDALDFFTDSAPIKIGRKWGLIDRLGALKLQPQFDQIGRFNDGAAPAYQEPYIGYISEDGRWIARQEHSPEGLPTQFDMYFWFSIMSFNEGLGGILDCKSWTVSFYNREGSQIFSLRAMSTEGFSEGLCTITSLSQSGTSEGVVDPEGDWVIEPVFSDIGRFCDGIAQARQGAKAGLIDREGNWVLELDEGWVQFLGDGVATVVYEEDRSFYRHLFDIHGKQLTRQWFRYADIPRNGRVPVFQVDKTLTLWDIENDRPLFEGFPSRRWAGDTQILDDGLVRFRLSTIWAIMDRDFNLKQLPQAELRDFQQVHDGLVVESADGKQKFWTTEGSLAFSRNFGSIESNFSDNRLVFQNEAGQSGAIDSAGEIVIPPSLKRIDKYENGQSIAMLAGAYGVIDEDGRWILDPTYRRLEKICGNLIAFSTGEYNSGPKQYGFIDFENEVVVKPRFVAVGDHAEGLIPVKSGEKWGYISQKGIEVIKPRFEQAGRFSRELAAAKLGGKWGYINKLGVFVIEPEYDCATTFSEGRAAVGLNSGDEEQPNRKTGTDWKMWYIDRNGKRVCKQEFYFAGSFSDGLAPVRMEDEGGETIWEYVDAQGELVTGLKLKSAGEFSEGYAVVLLPRQIAYVDLDGNIIWPPTY